MGAGSWDSGKWDQYATTNYGTSNRSTLRQSQAAMPSSSHLQEELDPAKMKNGVREARDSDDNPATTPIMIFTDVTGSMGHLSREVLTGMDTVCSELYDRKPVTDPTILTGATGDGYTDRAPIQVTQFEADIRIAEQTAKLYIEGNGGGNGGESYGLAWLFAAMQTSTDSYTKRGQKGFLFTVGDEPIHGVPGASGHDYAVTVDQAKKFLNLDIESNLTAEDLYGMVSRTWEVFHICLEERHYSADVQATFGKILGERLITIGSDDSAISSIPELIVSLVQVTAGHDKAAVAASWGGDKSIVIANALAGVPAVAGSGAGRSGDVAVL